jgi:hypothetical protein
MADSIYQNYKFIKIIILHALKYSTVQTNNSSQSENTFNH